jgi:hypothetical protein
MSKQCDGSGPHRRQHERHGGGRRLGVAAQVKFESKVSKRVITY